MSGDKPSPGTAGSQSSGGKRDLNRLFRPQSIAVMGGSWARSVIEQCQRMRFVGDIWPIHPRHQQVAGLQCYDSLEALPSPPDATFVGINRHLSIEAVRTLSAMGAGGVVCFASGFSEAAQEDADAQDLQHQLLEAAGHMPLIGPNCYGLINYLDGALLWPDQHGGERVESGVAFITQSSNIAINLTMQQRGLPVAYILTAGNQAQLSLGQLGAAIIEDERVTALALHIEGFGDIPAFERMAARARELGKPIIALKVGRSEQAQQAMVSHTSSLSGSDSAASAFLRRHGIARINSLPEMIESLKLLHVIGPLQGNQIQSMSCSGGEASLMADGAVDSAVDYPALTAQQHTDLRSALGPLVALANPLDYHTFIWDELPAMTETFTAMLRRKVDLSLLVLDFPRADRCEYPSWDKAVDALAAARDATGSATGIVASLTENMPEQIAKDLIRRGIVPLCGIDETLTAVETAHYLGQAAVQNAPAPTLQLQQNEHPHTILDESAAKQRLARYNVRLPVSVTVETIEELEQALDSLAMPVVLKGRGIAHKTEANAVVLNLQSHADIMQAARQMQEHVSGYLLEEYIDDCVAELLISIVRDSTHGFQLTLAAGGVLTELLADATHLLLPVQREDIATALTELKVFKLLNGFRGQPAASVNAIIGTVMALQEFALAHADNLNEIEINPLLCTATHAIVADALISLNGEDA